MALETIAFLGDGAALGAGCGTAIGQSGVLPDWSC